MFCAENIINLTINFNKLKNGDNMLNYSKVYKIEKNHNISKRRNIMERDSGVEFLKILAIFFVVISHVVQTLTQEGAYVLYDDYVYGIGNASKNITDFVLSAFWYFGSLGNSIFFICSAWFLQTSNSCSKKKILNLILEIWTISIIIMIATIICANNNIAFELIIKSLFPTTFSNNWYMTCYLIFYAVHPYINLVISNLEQKAHFRLGVCMTILYIGFNFIGQYFFFASTLLIWATIYIDMAYMRLYLLKFLNNIRYNGILLLIGISGYIGLLFITNVLGLYVGFFEDKMLYWSSNSNPFWIFISIALFNISRNIDFKNKYINYISSVSMLIYIIHENIILRSYLRPFIWNYIYESFGYSYLIVWVLVLAVIIFGCSLFAAIIYNIVCADKVTNISYKLYNYLSKVYVFVEKKFLVFK